MLVMKDVIFNISNLINDKLRAYNSAFQLNTHLTENNNDMEKKGKRVY